MKCQKCDINEATTHIKKIVNGNKSEIFLCSQCAGEENSIPSFKSVFDNDFEDFFTHFLGKSPSGQITLPGENACKTCGTTLRDIQNRGRLGCSDCYTAFYSFLQRPLKEIHGSNAHIGKLPKRAAKGIRLDCEIDKLKDELSRAVLNQNFEKAAELRDQIKEMEQKRG